MKLLRSIVLPWAAYDKQAMEKFKSRRRYRDRSERCKSLAGCG